MRSCVLLVLLLEFHGILSVLRMHHLPISMHRSIYSKMYNLPQRKSRCVNCVCDRKFITSFCKKAIKFFFLLKINAFRDGKRKIRGRSDFQIYHSLIRPLSRTVSYSVHFFRLHIRWLAHYLIPSLVRQLFCLPMRLPIRSLASKFF